MTKKYIVLGGYIFSANDDDRHYVPASKVAKLYNVKPKECILVNENDDKKLFGIITDDYITLTVRHDGKYENLGGEK